MRYSIKIRNSLMLLPFLLAGIAYGQRENVWIFSHYKGLNFNNTPPTTFIQTNLGSSTGEACASVSSTAGNLLFYSNGSRVWNANNNPMPNGNDITGLGNAATLSTSQGALIVPFPDNPQKYYLFSIIENELPERGRFYYSVIDMSLDGGLGDVVAGTKGILIDTGMAEKLTAVEGEDCNVWVVIRTLHQHINAYEISPAGVNTTPVTSFVGNPVAMTDNYTGQLAFAPNRRLLAETSIRLPAITTADGLHLYDFNPLTGVVTNSRQLLSNKAGYGVCFSGDNSKLYVQADSLYQFNLAAGSTSAIIASRAGLAAYTGLSAIKRGPDNKLYCKYFILQGAPTYWMACVQNPNLAGIASAFNPTQITLTTSFGPGLPNYIASRIVPKDTLGSHTYDTLNCFGVPPLTLSALLNTGSNYQWNNGTSGPQRTVTMGGIYWVGYNITPCVYRVDTFTIWSPSSVSPAVQTSAACYHASNGKAWLATGGGGYSLRWSRAADTVVLSTTDSLFPVPSGNYKVHIHTETGCDTTVFFTIPEENYQVSFTASDTLICFNESLTLTNTSPNHFTEYVWHLGDGNTATADDEVVHTYNRSGVFPVMLIGKGLICTDTAIRMIMVDTPSGHVSFTMDKREICVGDKIYFIPRGDSTVTSYQWSFGDGVHWDNTPAGTVHHAYDASGKMIITLTTRFRACEGTAATDSIWVHPLPVVDLGPDSVLCIDGPAIFVANHHPHTSGDQYLWSTGVTDRELKVVHHGEYSLRVTNKQGCSTSETIQVDKDCYVDIPNAFTPNGDGVNDYFFPRQLLSKSITGFRMQVFNRWGQVVFETLKTDGRGWDGRFNGKDQPQGVYIYLIEAIVKGNRNEKYQGNVTLVR